MLLIKFQEYFEKMYSCSGALMLGRLNMAGHGLSRPYPFNFYISCLPQILLGPLLYTLSQMFEIWKLSLSFDGLTWTTCSPISNLFCHHHQVLIVAIFDQIFDIFILTLFVHLQGCTINFNLFNSFMTQVSII